MNGIKGTGRRRLLVSMAMLSAAMFILLLPAYGQQEVNPDWYDPTPNAAAVHPAQTAAAAQSSRPLPAIHQHQQMATPLSAAGNAGKPRVNHAKLDQRSLNSDHKNGAVDEEAYKSAALAEGANESRIEQR